MPDLTYDQLHALAIIATVLCVGILMLWMLIQTQDRNRR